MNIPIAEYVGKSFESLTIIKEVSSPKPGRQVLCKCICGKVTTVPFRSLVPKTRLKSCGCAPRGRVIHGHARGAGSSTEYSVWSSMITRCTNSNAEKYRIYGGRGIKVCERWMSFKNFLEDMGPRPSKEYTLDRKDNDGNYEPSNCRWATKDIQNFNKSNTVFIEHNGLRLAATQWARRLNIPVTTIYARQRYGLTIEKVLFAGRLKRRVKSNFLRVPNV